MSPKKAGKKKASIIEVIQEMVSAGEPEEKIVQTLVDLGVEKEQAKRLLLLGEANTFAVLEAEIRKIVAKNLDEKKPEISSFIQEEVKTVGGKHKKESVKELSASLQGEAEKFRKNVQERQKKFESRVNSRLTELGDLAGSLKSNQEILTHEVEQFAADMNEVKLKGLGLKNRFVSLTFIGLGLAFLIVTMYLFVTRFGEAVTVDSIIITAIMAFIGVALLFVASII